MCAGVFDSDFEAQAQTVFLGINFYGGKFGDRQSSAHVMGHEYVDMLRKVQPVLSWDRVSREHVIQYREGGESFKVYYPTLQSIQDRLELAKSYGVGISIWELGQGLDYFFDLL